MLKLQNKNNRKIKKSQILLLGSLLIFLGEIALSYNFIKGLKEDIFEDMKQLILGEDINVSEKDSAGGGDDSSSTQAEDAANGNVNNGGNNGNAANGTGIYNKYLGVLEIPKIGLKKGFYNVDSRYNSIQYNVTVIQGSTMPDVNGGNLMLMAHSGTAYISFFRYLYKLNVGDVAYVTYGGRKYQYQIVNIYDTVKNGTITIERNFDVTTLTLITCTYNDETKQTVYIAELVG